MTEVSNKAQKSGPHLKTQKSVGFVCAFIRVVVHTKAAKRTSFDKWVTGNSSEREGHWCWPWCSSQTNHNLRVMAAVETRKESKHWKLRPECVLEYALTIFLKGQFQKLYDSEANTEKPGIKGGDVAKPHLEVSTTVGLCTLLLILQFCFPRHSPRLGEIACCRLSFLSVPIRDETVLLQPPFLI